MCDCGTDDATQEAAHETVSQGATTDTPSTEVDGDLSDDGEPESGAVGGRRVAGAEHLLAVGRGNPWPVVDDGEPHRFLALVAEPHLGDRQCPVRTTDVPRQFPFAVALPNPLGQPAGRPVRRGGGRRRLVADSSRPTISQHRSFARTTAPVSANNPR